jgi:hypothetical protein
MCNEVLKSNRNITEHISVKCGFNYFSLDVMAFSTATRISHLKTNSFKMRRSYP